MYEYKAILLRVIDADTVELDLDLGFYLYRRKTAYRLLRINAPERNTEDGRRAIIALQDYLPDKSLIAITQKSDSFGRWLTELYADNKNVSDWLVESGFAVYKSY